MAQNDKQLSILLFVILALIWGSSFILMKYALVTFTPMQIGALRIGFAGIFTAIIGFRSFRHFTKKDFWPLFIVGWLGNGIPYLLFPIAVARIDSSVVGVINSLVPLFTLIVGFIWFRFQPKWNQVVGIFIGFSGAYYLINPDGALNLDGDLRYALLAVAATVCYAISINTINTKLKHLQSVAITNLSLAMVAPFMLIYLFTTDFSSRLSMDTQALTSLGFVALLGIVGSSIAIIIFNYLIKISTPIFSSSVTYAIPIVAIVWGWFDGEVIGINHVVGVISILAGIYLVNMRKR